MRLGYQRFEHFTTKDMVSMSKIEIIRIMNNFDNDVDLDVSLSCVISY